MPEPNDKKEQQFQFFQSPLARPMRAVTSSSSISEMGLSSLPPSIATSLTSLSELCVEAHISDTENAGVDGIKYDKILPTFELSSKVEPMDFAKIDATPRPSRPVSDFRKYKTSMCRNWEQNGSCAFAESCIFAHGEGEIRSETNNETLKLANVLIGAEEPSVNRRARRRRKKTEIKVTLGDTEENLDKQHTGLKSFNAILEDVFKEFPNHINFQVTEESSVSPLNKVQNSFPKEKGNYAPVKAQKNNLERETIRLIPRTPTKLPHYCFSPDPISSPIYPMAAGNFGSHWHRSMVPTTRWF